MFDNLLSQMQDQATEIKQKLDKTIVEGQSENGLVKVTANGNKKILSISISDEIANEKETIEDLTIVAINKAINKAEEIAEKESKAMANNMLPNMGNIFGK